jgi:hypothetical protein
MNKKHELITSEVLKETKRRREDCVGDDFGGMGVWVGGVIFERRESVLCAGPYYIEKFISLLSQNIERNNKQLYAECKLHFRSVTQILMYVHC